MAFGARGSARDFGLSSGLALPVNARREHNATSEQVMPQEKTGRRKGFAVEHEGVDSNKKRLSIASRIRNWFRKSKKPSSEPSRSQNNTLSRPPNLATIPEQSEEDNQHRVKEEGPVESKQSKVGGRSVDDEVLLRGRKRPPDRKKAYSTAFEHTIPSTQETLTDKVHLTLQTPTAGPRKVVLQRSPEHDSFGFHLSGGQPPITITYVKPGSLAGQKGVKAGDVLLDLNGINCRKRVDISQLMKMKSMFQQPHRSSTEEQTLGAPAGIVRTKVTVTDVRKGDPNNNHRGELGDPLAASSPIKSSLPPKENLASNEQSEGKHAKKISKRKTSKEEKKIADKSTEDTGPRLSAEVESKADELQRKPRSKKKKNKDSSCTPAEEKPKADGERKKSGKKKKTRSSIIEVQEDEDTINETETLDLEPVLSVDVDPTPSHSVVDEDTIENAGSVQHKGADTIQDEEEVNVQRKDRNRRSKSPKSRYQMDESELAAEGEGDVKEKVPKKKKKATKSMSGEEKEKKKKKTDKSTTGEDKKEKASASGENKEKKKKKSTPTKKASKKAASENSQQDATEESAAAKVPAELPILSAAVSGSFESDTMEFVPKNKSSTSEIRDEKEDEDADGSKNSLKRSKKKRRKDDDVRTQSLKREKKKEKSSFRRASVDQEVVSSDKQRMSNSQSFSSVEEQKRFREELKEASKSEHDIADLANSMDPNIKVKRSGLVKSKSSSSSRPSIFNQSSSPEPEMTSMSSLTASEKEIETPTGADGLPDPDFKVKKSGVVVGRKTSSGIRPSILDEQSSAAFSDVHPGEMKYNKDVEMDLNLVPQIAPSLGLVAGRDRLDATNQSLTKRRPPSLRQTSQESSESYPLDTTSRMAAARKMFEKPANTQESTSRFNGRSFSKSVEKPPKALSVPGESTITATPAKVQDKPAPHPANAWASNRATKTQSTVIEESTTSAPSWVTKAQGVHKQASVLETSSPPSKTTTTPTSGAPVTSTNGIPAMGHVAARLAMFQK